MALSLGAALLGSSIIGGGLSFLGSQQAAGTQAQASLQASQTQLMGLALAQQFQREQTDQAIAANKTGIETARGMLPSIQYPIQQARGVLTDSSQQAQQTLLGNANNAISTASNYGNSALQNFNAGFGNAQNALQTGMGYQSGAIDNALAQARGGLGYGYDAATGQIGGGVNSALGYQQQGAGGAIGSINNALAYNNASLSPYTSAGNNATATLSQLYGMQGPQAQQATFGQFQASPDYQFAQSEGMRALENSNAAKGLLQSSGHLRSAQEFGQGLASQQYGNYVNRLQAIANQGLSATNTGVAANQAAGQGLANTYTGLGTAQGATALSGANAMAGLSSGYGQNLASAAMSGGNALSNIYGTNFGGLANLSSQQGAGGAGLITGVGNTLTGLYTGLGTGLSGLQTGLGQGLAGLYGADAATMQRFSDLQAGLTANQAGLFSNQGNALANLAVQGGNAAAAGIQGAGQANASGIVGGTNAINSSLGNVSNQLLLGSLLGSKGGNNILGNNIFG